MSAIITLLAKVDAEGFRPSRDFLVKLFKELRKTKVRRPDVICKYASQMLSYCGDDVEGWTMHEFVFLASLDEGNDQLADRALQPVLKRFPGSTRAQILLGQWNEYKGEYDTALSLYNELLKAHPTNLAVMKRKVCVFRSQNKLSEAIQELNGIVSIFYSDPQSWLELADIYITLSDFKAAVVCLEELALLQSNSPLIHARLAEVYYTLGSRENLVQARHHYSTSLHLLNPEHNLRALYGLIATCTDLLDIVPSKKQAAASPEEIAVSTELLTWAKEKLMEASVTGKGASNVMSFVAQAISPAFPERQAVDRK